MRVTDKATKRRRTKAGHEVGGNKSERLQGHDWGKNCKFDIFYLLLIYSFFGLIVMGDAQSALKPETLSDLSRETSFTEDEIEEWYKGFIKKAQVP